MANLTIHNIDESVADNLREQAQRHGQTMEEEARQILRLAFSGTPQETGGLGSKIARRFAGVGGVDLPQSVRSLPRQPAGFGEAD